MASYILQSLHAPNLAALLQPDRAGDIIESPKHIDLPSTAFLQRARSSVRIEQRTSDPLVGGSNPSGRASVFKGFRVRERTPKSSLTPKHKERLRHSPPAGGSFFITRAKIPQEARSGPG